MQGLKSVPTIVFILLLVSCDKLEINVSNLWGTWFEYYDSETFSLDGSVEYTFHQVGANGEIHIYDALSGEEKTVKITYMLEGDVITINPIMSGFSTTSYKIVKFGRKEMAWQKVGTKYSKGTWHSDYLHFRRL